MRKILLFVIGTAVAFGTFMAGCRDTGHNGTTSSLPQEEPGRVIESVEISGNADMAAEMTAIEIPEAIELEDADEDAEKGLAVAEAKLMERLNLKHGDEDTQIAVVDQVDGQEVELVEIPSPAKIWSSQEKGRISGGTKPGVSAMAASQGKDDPEGIEPEWPEIDDSDMISPDRSLVSGKPLVATSESSVSIPALPEINTERKISAAPESDIAPEALDVLVDVTYVKDIISDDDADEAETAEAGEEKTEEAEGDAGETAKAEPVDNETAEKAADGEAEVADGNAVADEGKEATGDEAPEKKRISELARRERIIAQARAKEAEAKYVKGLNLYKNRLYEEALVAFNDALEFDPAHEQSRMYRNRCETLLGTKSDNKGDRIIQEITDREVAGRQAIEMKLRTDLEDAEKLYLKAINPDEVSRELPRIEQFAEALAFLDKSLERLRQVDSVLGTSPITAAAQKSIRLRVEALKAMVIESRTGIQEARQKYERELAAERAREHKLQTDLNHRKRIEKIYTSAKYFFTRKEYDKAREMCEELLKLDPYNQDAINLRNKSRFESHRKANRNNERDLQDSETMWSLDVRSAAILPSDDLIYPENWEQIKRRVTRKREMDSGSELERKIRERLQNEKISVEYVQQPLMDVINELRDRGRINIVTAADVDPNLEVSLTLSNKSLGTVLKYIVEFNGLHYEIRDEAVLISEQRKSKVLLQIYPVYDLTRQMKDYFPPGDDDDDDDDDDDVEDQPFTDIRERITEVIPGNWEDDPAISIALWEDNLMVMQTPEVHAQIVAYLNKLRVFSKQQVLVEGRFLDIQDSLLEEIGVTWYDKTVVPSTSPVQNQVYGFRNYTLDNGRELDVGVSVQPGTGAAGGSTSSYGANLNLGYLSQAILNQSMHQLEVSASIHALKEKMRGSVLHNPRLLVQNGKNAYLEIKTITNYVSRYTQQGSVFQPETDEYEQGIEWSVRPVISYDRKYITIRMRPKLEAFDAANSRTIIERRLTTIASTGDTNLAGVVEYPYFLPVLQITQMETYVTIPDGGTILMGGLIQDNRNENISGVPLLSSIPFVGRLTRSESRDYEKQNMVIMVQGKIIELE